MAIVSTEYITTGGGKLYIEPFVNGAPSGEQSYFGITDEVSLSTEVEYLEHKNTESAVTKTDKKVQKSSSATIKFTSSEISPRMLSRAYAGIITVNSQTAQISTPVTIAGVKGGYVYDVGYMNLTTVTVKDSTDTTTYVEGTDYSLDRGAGRIEIIEGGSIVDGTDIHLTVDADAFESNLVAGLKGSALEARLVFISEPLAGKRYKYTFKKVSISASGDLPLKSEDYAKISFEGSALADESVTDPTLSDYFDIEEIPA